MACHMTEINRFSSFDLHIRISLKHRLSSRAAATISTKTNDDDDKNNYINSNHIGSKTAREIIAKQIVANTDFTLQNEFGL